MKYICKNPSIKKVYLFQKRFTTVHYQNHRRYVIPNAMAYLMTNKIMEEISRREAEIDAITYYTKRYTLDESDV